MKKLGFTLIELLVVVSLIAILTGIAAVSYNRSVKLSRDSRVKTDLEQVRQALETYRSENGTYPDTADYGTLAPDFIQTLPTNPKTGAGYTYTQDSPTSYSLCGTLELPADGTEYCVGNP